MKDGEVRHALAALELLKPTVDLDRRAEHTAEQGWHIESHEGTLPSESPGPPLDGGPFMIACDVVREYKFPPPDLITGYFDAARPIGERILLLDARFLWLRFRFGVRVSGVIDEHRTVAGVEEQSWGYRYVTLDGHYEQGEITFEIVKLIASGDVRFRMRSFSRTGEIRNLIHRWGFRMFGRRLQRRFARESMQRLRSLVEERMQ